MANLQKIIKVTKAQYDTLASGGTVGDYTGLDANFLYLVQDDSATIIDITNGLTSAIKAQVEANPACLLVYDSLVYTPSYWDKSVTSIPDYYVCVADSSVEVFWIEINWTTLEIADNGEYYLVTGDNISDYVDLTNYVTTNTVQTITETKYSSDILPRTANTYSLGGVNNKWLNGYFSGRLYTPVIDNESGDVKVVVGNNKGLLPSWDNHYNLGNVGYRWKDGYIGGELYLGRPIPSSRTVDAEPYKINYINAGSFSTSSYYNFYPITGVGDWFYLAYKKSNFTIKATFKGTGQASDTYNASMYDQASDGGYMQFAFDWKYSDGWRPWVANISSSTPAIIEIKSSTRCTYTDVLRLYITGHNANDSGSNYSGFLNDYTIEVCTDYDNDTWATIVNRSGVSDALGTGLIFPMHTSSYTACYGVRITVTKATAGTGYQFLNFTSIQLRDSRPDFGVWDSVGAISQDGGNIYGDLILSNRNTYQTIRPLVDNTQSLGTSSYRFGAMHAVNTYSNSIRSESGSALYLNPANSIAYLNGTFLPSGTSSSDLGSSSYNWRNLYMSGNISNGTYTWSFPTSTGTLLTNNSLIEVSKLTDTLSYNTRGNINPYDTLFVPDYSVDRLYLYGTYYGNSASSLIDIEYTQDGGTTWTDAGYPISTKQLLFTHNLAGNIKVGDASTTTSPTMTESTYQNYMTRVTIKRDTSETKYYCSINKFFCIASGGNRGKVKIQYSTNADPTTFVDWNDWAEVSGWPGPNVMRLSSLKSFDGNGSTQLYAIRLIFGYSSFNASYASSMNTVGDFRFFGPGAFGDMVKNNDPYEVVYTGAVNPKLGDAKQDLGSTALRWRNAYLSGALYLTGNLHDGTNAVTVANIVTRNTAQTISATKTFTASPVIDNGQSTYNRRYTTISPLEWKMSSPSKTSMVTLTPNGLKMEKEDTPHYIELALNTSYVATIKHGASGAYTATFPAKTGTVAMTDDLPVVPEVPKLYKHIITHSQLGTGQKLIIFSFYATLDENNYLALQKIVDRAIFVGLIPSSTSDANYHQIILNRSSAGVNCTGYYFASTTPTNITIYNPMINGSIVDTIEEVSI